MLLLGAVYTFGALSPSSYGFVRERMGFVETGTIVGKARSIRSDEYGLWTPMVQILVRNGFERINTSSPYKEDLRNFYALPLWDWGLVFKPQFWPFFFAPPEYAYAFYHAAHIVLFLIGWHLFLLALGFPRGWSIPLSVTLLFSGFVQYWWVNLGLHFAILPWYGLIFLKLEAFWPRAVAASYVTAMWMMSVQFYPPLVLNICLIGAVFVLVFKARSVTLPRVCSLVLGTAVGSAIVTFYYWEPIHFLAGTVSHGDRSYAGGGMPFQTWFGQILPYFDISRFDSFQAPNICEAGSLSSYVFLLTVCFIDYGKLGMAWREASAGMAIKLMFPLIPFVAVAVWQFADIPAWFGFPLLWHKIPFWRLSVVGSGMVLVAALIMLRMSAVVFTWQRLAVFTALSIVMWLASKGVFPDEPSFSDLTELTIVPAIFIGWWAVRRFRLNHASQACVLLFAAMVGNIAMFGPFNPLHSATAIFQTPDMAKTKILHIKQAAHPDGLLLPAGPGTHGAVLNGIGFNALAHVVTVPSANYFGFLKRHFGYLSKEQFRLSFNRIAIIRPGWKRPPLWRDPLLMPVPVGGDGLVVPVGRFYRTPVVEMGSTDPMVTIDNSDEYWRLSRVEWLATTKPRLWISGKFDGRKSDVKLSLISNGIASIGDVMAYDSQDRYAPGSIEMPYDTVLIDLNLREPQPLGDTKLALCIVAETPDGRRSLVSNRSGQNMTCDR